MARKAAHDQKSTPDNWQCDPCKKGECNRCIDIMRVIKLRLPEMCKCKKRGHSGEARDNQILDPETGTVYGPGLRVTQEGEVIRDRDAAAG